MKDLKKTPGAAHSFNLFERFFGKKIDGTRVRPVTTKIIIIFTVFILASNFSSNYINLLLNRSELINMMKDQISRELKDINNFCNNQFEIYQYTENLPESIEAINQKGLREMRKNKSLLLGIRKDGTLLFESSRIAKQQRLKDPKAMDILNRSLMDKISDGFITFRFNDEEYFGSYKHNQKWDIVIVRAEEYNEFFERSRVIFRNISIIIIFITIASAIIGVFILQYILRFIGHITREIMNMIRNQQMGIIDLSGAPNDDITYMGMALNSLSSTIDNMVRIFRKFVNRDVVIKAYREKTIRLEGEERNLTILFSDIKSFTFITETLGSDIIKLLNLHYNKAINEIIENDGIIGSIIGDALLAVFGAMDESAENKSMQAVKSAYKLQQVARELRSGMKAIQQDIIKQKGKLTAVEKKVYKSVLLQIGVGIDGGNVFYGNIGSYQRMTNTVIGDNVNSSARLEGLTRIYKLPVICSEYVKNDIEANVKKHDLRFIEIDTVQVKGKTIGRKIYWPIFLKNLDPTLEEKISDYTRALELYYKGDWSRAEKLFESCTLPPAPVFIERIKGRTSPRGWNGVWEMETK
jgi:class 3 adenylate cyclase